MLRAWQECEVGKALARRQLAHDVVEPPCAVKSKGQRIGERVFVVVLDMARLEMRLFYARGHGGGVFLEDCCEQGVRGLYGAAHDLPFLALLCRCDVFAQNLVIRNKDFLFPSVIAEVAEVHQERHDIVCRCEGRHIIRESQCIDFLPPASHHFDNGIAQPALVEVDVDLESLIRLGLCPVIVILPPQHGLDDAFRAEYMLTVRERIPIIPGAALGKIHVILLAQPFYLIFGKANIRRKRPRILHRIFREHIER